MNSASCVRPKSNVRLRLNLGERGEKGLGVVVVKDAWLPVVLGDNWNNRADLNWLNHVFLAELGAFSVETWHIAEWLLPSLFGVFVRFYRKIELGLEPRVEAPVANFLFSEGLLFDFSACVVVSPGYSSSEVVPISVSVDRKGQAERPEDPTHLADHPNVRLTHIVTDMEHHS